MNTENVKEITEYCKSKLPEEACGYVYNDNHDVRAGIVGAFVTELVAVFLPLLAENDTAPVCTELRLVFIGAVATRTGAFFRKRPLAEAAVQPAGGNHFGGDFQSFMMRYLKFFFQKPRLLF